MSTGARLPWPEAYALAAEAPAPTPWRTRRVWERSIPCVPPAQRDELAVKGFAFFERLHDAGLQAGTPLTQDVQPLAVIGAAAH